MNVLALTLYGLYLLVGFVARTLIQLRRTGDTGFRGLSGRPGSAAWFAGIAFVIALLAGFAAPIAGLAGLDPMGAMSAGWVQALGLVLAALGIVFTLAAQVRMGEQWRIGIGLDETTELVTSGAFALVRNPVFTAMGLTAVGLALLTPNAVAVVALIALVLALELQVRIVEEPYLRALHGTIYADYEVRVGRFLPHVGTARTTDPAGAAKTEAGATSGHADAVAAVSPVRKLV